MDAMLLAYGIADESRIDMLEEVEGMVKEDVEYVKGLAEQMKKHWEETSYFLENSRNRINCCR